MGSGGKKTFNKKICKKLFLLRRFHTLFEQKLSNLRSFLSSIFPKDKENQKSLDIELMEVGRKVPLNGVRNTNTKKILLRETKFAQKQRN